jgi:hypothetical protein
VRGILIIEYFEGSEFKGREGKIGMDKVDFIISLKLSIENNLIFFPISLKLHSASKIIEYFKIFGINTIDIESNP